MDQNNNPLIEKLTEFGKSKTIITWENVTDILGQDFIHTPEMENVLKLLEENKIQLIETDIIGLDDAQDDEDEDDIMSCLVGLTCCSHSFQYFAFRMSTES